MSKSIDKIIDRVGEHVDIRNELVEKYPELPEWESENDEVANLTFYEYHSGWIDALHWVLGIPFGEIENSATEVQDE